MTRINEISSILLYFESHLQELQFTGDTETKWGVWVQWENVWNHLEWENEIWMENGIIGNMLQRIETFSHKENYFLSSFFLYFVTDFICFEWDFPFLIRFLFSFKYNGNNFIIIILQKSDVGGSLCENVCCFRLIFCFWMLTEFRLIFS